MKQTGASLCHLNSELPKLKSFKKSAAQALDQPKSCFLQELSYF